MHQLFGMWVIWSLTIHTLSFHNFKALVPNDFTCKWKLLFVSAGRSWMRRGVQVSYWKLSALPSKKGERSLRQRCSGFQWTNAAAGLFYSHLLKHTYSVYLDRMCRCRNMFRREHIFFVCCQWRGRQEFSVWADRSRWYRSWWHWQTSWVTHSKPVSTTSTYTAPLHCSGLKSQCWSVKSQRWCV